MSAPPKLTKKQKKGLAFRERKGKSKSQDPDTNAASIAPSSSKLKHRDLDQDVDNMGRNPYPAMEDEDHASLDGGAGQVGGNKNQKQSAKGKDKERREERCEEGREESEEKRGEEREDVRESVAVLKGGRSKEKVAGKRKREEGEDGDAKKTKKKKKASEDVEDEEKEDKMKQRWILFVGNLKYTTSKDAIQNHFAACDPPPSIRLLTPKSKPSSSGSLTKQSHKSKGCAFLEFSSRLPLQQALKLHQSTLEGRMINVELTAGGGGKSEKRLNKVRERNKGLLKQRVKRAEASTQDDPSAFPEQPQKPQRFSMTSGIDQKPLAKKTWTVGDVDDGETHRGGERHRGKKKPKNKEGSKTWGTGVNAIPVG